MLEHVEYLQPEVRGRITAGIDPATLEIIASLPRAAYVGMDVFMPLLTVVAHELGPKTFIEYYAEVMVAELDSAMLASLADASFRLFGMHAFQKVVPRGFPSVAPGCGDVVVEQSADGQSATISWIGVPREASHPVTHPHVYLGIIRGICQRFGFDVEIEIDERRAFEGRYDFNLQIVQAAARRMAS